jgi:hypothetical protein
LKFFNHNLIGNEFFIPSISVTCVAHFLIGTFCVFISFCYFIQAFLDAIVNLEFQTVESLWREFWRSQDNNNGDECEEEKYLSKYV